MTKTIMTRENMIKYSTQRFKFIRGKLQDLNKKIILFTDDISSAIKIIQAWNDDEESQSVQKSIEILCEVNNKITRLSRKLKIPESEDAYQLTLETLAYLVRFKRDMKTTGN